MRASRWKKRILAVGVICGLFVAGIFVEVSLRTAQKRPIPVDNTFAPDVIINASQMPGFLWTGTQWWINYESPVSFVIYLGWDSSLVPAGTHRIYSSHDNNNLNKYGLIYMGITPARIVVRQTQP